LLTGQPDTTAEDGVTWLKELCVTLDIQPLSAYGISPADLPEIVSRAQKASSMKGNPIKLTENELKEILEKAL
jgi:alcohol dehydrogenase class IV